MQYYSSYIDLCLQTFPKLLLLLVPKVTTRSLYPECIANLKLPIDAFYRESRSDVNTDIDLFILKNMGAAIIDFRVCPPLVKCQKSYVLGIY